MHHVGHKTDYVKAAPNDPRISLPHQTMASNRKGMITTTTPSPVIARACERERGGQRQQHTQDKAQPQTHKDKMQHSKQLYHRSPKETNLAWIPSATITKPQLEKKSGTPTLVQGSVHNLTLIEEKSLIKKNNGYAEMVHNNVQQAAQSPQTTLLTTPETSAAPSKPTVYQAANGVKIKSTPKKSERVSNVPDDEKIIINNRMTSTTATPTTTPKTATTMSTTSTTAATATIISNTSTTPNVAVSSASTTPNVPVSTTSTAPIAAVSTTSTAPTLVIPPFNWDIYLKLMPGEIAPKEAFMQAIDYPPNLFIPGMKLEARDSRSNSWCLASVIYSEGLRLRLRFEGSDSMNDLFELVDSDNIRAVGSKPEDILSPPMNYKGNLSTYPKFVEKVLTKSDTIIASPECFVSQPKKPETNLFVKGMKLEAIDRKNPYLICPATIGEVTGNDVTITFDGWRGSFDYVCKYFSRDLFPVNWCHNTNHNITKPNGWDGFFNGTPVKEPKNLPKKILSATPAPSKAKPKVSISKTNTTPKQTQSNSKKVVKPSPKTPLPVPKVTPPLISIIDNEPDESTDIVEDDDDDDDLKELDAKDKYQCQRTVTYKQWLWTKQSKQLLTQANTTTYSSDTIINSSAETSVDSNLEQKHPTEPTTQPKPKARKDDEVHEPRDEFVKKHKPEEPIFNQPSVGLSSASLSAPIPTSSNASTSASESSRAIFPPAKSKPVKELTVADVLDLLKVDESLSKISKIFENHEIDGKALLLLTTDMMINHMGLKIGPVLKINDLIDRLKRSD